jgi:FixJ family two-component response regulator
VASVVYLVDDDRAILTALCRLLSSHGFLVYPHLTAHSFLKHYDESMPGCVIIDVSLPDLNGIALQRELLESGMQPAIIFLTGTGTIPACVEAMKDGAVDFLTKPVEEEDLLLAVHAAIEKDRLTRQERTELQMLQDKLTTLSSREREVFEHVVQGELNKEIASQLHVVEKTVKVHRGRVVRKMGANSLAELVRMSEKLGIGRKTD